MALAPVRGSEIRASSAGAADEIKLVPDGANSVFTNTTGTLTIENTGSNQDVIFEINDGGVATEVLRIKAATSELYHGAVDAFNFALVKGASATLQKTAANANFNFVTYSNNSNNKCNINMSRYGGTEGVPAVSVAGDAIGSCQYLGYDGTTIRSVADVNAKVDTVTGADNISGYVTIGTRNDGAAAVVTERLRVGKTGMLSNLASYSAVIGGTNIDLYCDNAGNFGPAPSSIRYKENIKSLKPGDTEWVLNVPVKSFNFKGVSTEEIGVIAEELEEINPAAVRYDVFEVDGEELKKIDRGQFKPVKDEPLIEKNKKIREVFKRKMTVLEKNEKDEMIEVEREVELEMDVKRVPDGINKDVLFFALLSEVQRLNARVAALEAK